MSNQLLGIDIGGTGIKGALIDVNTGNLISDRFKVSTPFTSSPANVIEAVKEVIDMIGYQGDKIGFGFPSIVDKGVCKSASNISDEWIGMNLNSFFSDNLNKECTVINDADAAGIAEVEFSDVNTADSTVILLTLGTGIGSAILCNGHLLPNSELGHLKFEGTIAEKFTSNKVREKEDLTYKQWGRRLNMFLNHIEHLFSPNHIILGGGVSKKMEKYKQHLNTKCQLTPCYLLNNAGIVGAALYASQAK